ASKHYSIKGIAAYALTKTTLVGLTQALAHGLAKDNIRVNGIAPGVIKTKMSEALWHGNGDEGEKDMVDAMEVGFHVVSAGLQESGP
ncbi:hypothetical protein ANCDUO_21880, partial [Ancylostoma duodenale]